LTNGAGSTLGGSGVVTGSVVFASGSAWEQTKAEDSGALLVTGSTVFESDVSIKLSGYSVQDLETGIPLISAGGAGSIQSPGRMPVTLDGASDSTWLTSLSTDGKNLAARVIYFGTILIVR